MEATTGENTTTWAKKGARIGHNVIFSAATWHKYREALEDVILKYPAIFGPYEKGSRNFDDFGNVYREGESFTDNWGCVWENSFAGLEGRISYHPLADWANLEKYSAPDPLLYEERAPRANWAEIEKAGRESLAKTGEFTAFADRYYERLHFLRGWENFMMDVALDEPGLEKVKEIVIGHNEKLIKKFIEIGANNFFFADDLGMQDRLQISPASWRKHIKPGYAHLVGLCKKAGAKAGMHTDGYIMDIAQDLVEIGLDTLNIQDMVNGLDNIARELKGKVTIAIDIDRQWLMPFGKPEDVRSHIKRVAETLGSPEGGLFFSVDIYPDVPLENIEALCQAIIEFRDYYV